MLGFSGAVYKGFDSMLDAEEFMNHKSYRLAKPMKQYQWTEINAGSNVQVAAGQST